MERMSYIASLWLLFFTFRGSLSEQAKPLLKTSGSDAKFEWTLLYRNISLFTVSLDGNLTLFYTSLSNPGNVYVDEKYTNRLNKSDIKLDKSVTFVLKNISAADAGRYICIEGLNSDPSIPDCGQMLVIIEPPDNVSVVAMGTPVAGGRFGLECHADSNSLPSDHGLKPTVLWQDGAGRSLANSGDKIEDNRLILSIERVDEGQQFTCKASDGLDVWSASSPPYILLPEYAPTEADVKFLPEQSIVTTFMGDSVEQTCQAACRPNCTLIWQKRFGEDYINETKDGILSLPGIQRDKHGVYRCLASNTHGSAFRDFIVDIQYAPSLQNVSVNGNAVDRASVMENEAVNMSCTFDSNPAPTVMWTSKENTSLMLQNDSFVLYQSHRVMQNGIPRILYTSYFFIAQTVCTQTGEYFCKARNPRDSVTDGTVNLFVKCMPRYTEGGGLSKLYIIELGKPLRINFQVVGYPSPTISRIISEDSNGVRALVSDEWSIKKQIDDKSPALTNFSLQLDATASKNFDHDYYLTIENNEGNMDLAFRLMERGPPKQPHNLTCIKSEESSILLSWQAGFHGGDSQRFVVEYQSFSEPRNEQWESVPVSFLQENIVDEGMAVQMTLTDLKPSTQYIIRVKAINIYGSTSSSVLTVSTTALQPSSAGAGPVVGGILAVVVIIGVCAIIIYLVIRRRRERLSSQDKGAAKPMLSSSEEDGKAGLYEPVALSTNSHSIPLNSINNNPGNHSGKTSQSAGDDLKKNQDGLIYADLDLRATSSERPVLGAQDRVNYETIDFTRTAPLPPSPEDIELREEDEELK
ncbi:hemicentin-2-like isoform X2 [Pomacea canaliculata]|uniref:hemicentin-2-like isoform X2 n=1 Tax=Pomacea canaliculata TaxID=400727 RepID=UPI000D7369AC|nr:hemicentin-2-like isoform X2 [Pomacea canaliculata]